MNWKVIWRSLKHSDMRKRLLAVAGMILVFRILAQIPIPLAEPTTLKGLLDTLFTASKDTQLLGFLDVLSGGALANFSIILIGLGPFINASIIMQLLTQAIPKLEALNKAYKSVHFFLEAINLNLSEKSPYPTKKEIEDIAKSQNETFQRVYTWFRAQRRKQFQNGFLKHDVFIHFSNLMRLFLEKKCVF